MRCWTAKPWIWTLTHLTVTQEFLFSLLLSLQLYLFVALSPDVI